MMNHGVHDEQQAPLRGAAAHPGPGRNVRGKNLGSYVPFMWFAAACCVMAGGIIGFVCMLLSSFKIVDCLDEVYLVLFGLVVAILDFPMNPAIIQEPRTLINKYAMFLGRLMGKGLFLNFLGTMTLASLWNNSISYILAIVLGLFVIAAGLFTLIYGYAKTRQLERVRFALHDKVRQGAKLNDIYNQYAHDHPLAGMTKAEFGTLARNEAHIELERDMLQLVFQAMAEHVDKERLTAIDLGDWVNNATPLYL